MTEQEVLDVVRSCTTEVLPHLDPAEVTLDGNLTDLGANSIDRADVATLAMEKLGIAVPVGEFQGVNDIRSLVAVLRKHA
jgi:polyketide biosynthesis acyl carrier protein